MAAAEDADDQPDGTWAQQWPPWKHHMDQSTRDAFAAWLLLRRWQRMLREPSLQPASYSEEWQRSARLQLEERAQKLAAEAAASRAKKESAAVVVQRFGRGKIARQRARKERARRAEAAEQERAREQAAAVAAAKVAAEAEGEQAKEEADYKRQREEVHTRTMRL